jgi:hypothetical protein
LYSSELKFAEKAYSLMNEKFRKWKPDDKLNWQNQEQFRDSPEYKEFLNEIFVTIEKVDGTSLNDLYNKLLNIRAEKGKLIKRFYFNHYELPLNSLLIESVYEMYPMHKANGDWISAYAITRFIYGAEKYYEYNLSEDLSWKRYIGYNYNPWKLYIMPIIILIEPYAAILFDTLISLFFSGIVLYFIHKKKHEL